MRLSLSTMGRKEVIIEKITGVLFFMRPFFSGSIIVNFDSIKIHVESEELELIVEKDAKNITNKQNKFK